MNGNNPTLMHAIKGPVMMITTGWCCSRVNQMTEVHPGSNLARVPDRTRTVEPRGSFSRAARGCNQPARSGLRWPAMRGRSIVGPFVLIALGGIFLLNNIRPELNLFSLFAKYWPFLLIGLGVLRLLEVLAYAAGSKPLPTRGFSGGEVFLLVLLCIVGSAVFHFRHPWGPFHIGPRTMEIFGESFDYPVSQQKEIGENSRILFDNVRGNVRVNGGDAAEIRITGHKTIRAYNKGDAGRGQRAVSARSDCGRGDRVIVRTNQEKVSEQRRLVEPISK